MRCSGEAWPQTPLDAHALSGFGPSESAHWPRISLLQVITYMQWLLKNLMTAQLMKLKHKKVVLNTQFYYGASYCRILCFLWDLVTRAGFFKRRIMLSTG